MIRVGNKAFATVLRTASSSVEKIAKQYDAQRISKKRAPKTLPETFFPINLWSNYLSPIQNQGKCGNCWAHAVAGALSDRYALFTLGQCKPILSPDQLTICYGVIDPGGDPLQLTDRIIKEIQAHSSAACTGNTIYDAVKYIYAYGVQDNKCFDDTILKKRGYNLNVMTEPKELPYCSDVIAIDYNKCIDGITHARFYRSMASYNLPNDVEAIKTEIYKFGPVVSGMVIYSSFLESYAGHAIYLGPEKGEVAQGGHAVRIVGWGRENDIDYWLVANSWGRAWGLNGYFKMKMNIPECELEKNVVAFVPDIQTFKADFLDYIITENTEDATKRTWFDVDNYTGFKFSYLRDLQRQNIPTSPLYIVSNLPNFAVFWAGEISPYPIPMFYQGLDPENIVDQAATRQIMFLLVILFLAPVVLAYLYIRFRPC